MTKKTAKKTPVKKTTRRATAKSSKPTTLHYCLFWLVVFFASIGFAGTAYWAASTAYTILAPATETRFESQVRQWAKPYPADLRNRWAWCYLDSAENWSTDEKLREDVRLKSTQVLTDDERQTLIPLDDQIRDAIPKQRTSLRETYQNVGNGLKVNDWTPPPATTTPPKPEPPPPIRRGIFNRSTAF